MAIKRLNEQPDKEYLFYKRYFFPKFFSVLKKLDRSAGLRPILFSKIRHAMGYSYKLKKEETNKILRLMEKEGLILTGIRGVFLKRAEGKPKTVLAQMRLDKWCEK
jgi:hypothetical protein